MGIKLLTVDDLEGNDRELVKYYLEWIQRTQHQYVEARIADSISELESLEEETSQSQVVNALRKSLLMGLAIDMANIYPTKWEKFVTKLVTAAAGTEMEDSIITNLLSFYRNIPFEAIKEMDAIEPNILAGNDQINTELRNAYFLPRLTTPEAIEYLFEWLSSDYRNSLPLTYPPETLCKLREQIEIKCEGKTHDNCRDMLEHLTNHCGVTVKGGQILL
jgi:hypothetical protein